MAGIFLSPFSFPPSPEERGAKIKVSREHGSNLNLAEFCTVYLSAEVLFNLGRGWFVVKALALPGSTETHVRRGGWGCGRRLPAQAFSVLGLCVKRAEKEASEDAETARAVRVCHLYYLLNLSIS